MTLSGIGDELALGWRALLGLVLPVDCPGCEQDSDWQREPWCTACAPEYDLRTVEPTPRPAELPVTYCCGEYDGALREALLAYKDGRRRDLGRDFAIFLSMAANDAGWKGCTLVPIPSSRRAIRMRGFEHTLDLARRCARQLEGADVAQLLARPRPGEDQGGRRARQRARRTHSLRPSVARRAEYTGPIVLIDDIATTGWTLASARRALENGGYEVRGALVLAAPVLRAAACAVTRVR